MARVLLVTSRPAELQSFAAGLAGAEGVELERVDSWAQALDLARELAKVRGPRQLRLVVLDAAGEPDVVGAGLDAGPDDVDQAARARLGELMLVNAMIDTAVLSRLDEDAFHEGYEGLGVLLRLPPTPGPVDARRLLSALAGLGGPGSPAGS